MPRRLYGLATTTLEMCSASRCWNASKYPQTCHIIYLRPALGRAMHFSTEGSFCTKESMMAMYLK